MKHYFDFVTLGLGKREIKEPAGWDAAGFIIEQDEGRKGRDIRKAAAGSQMQLYADMHGHYFDYVLETFRRSPVEGVINYSVEILGTEYFVGKVSMITLVTDWVNKIEFSIQEPNSEIKTQYEVNVNLFNDKRLDGMDIAPCTKEYVYLPAKNVVQVSKWNNLGTTTMFSSGNTILPGFFNPIKNVEKYGVKSSLSWLFDGTTTNGGNAPSFYTSPPQDFKLIRAADNLSRGKAVINLNMTTIRRAGGIQSNLQVLGIFFKCVDNADWNTFKAATSTQIRFYDTGALMSEGQSYTYNGTQTIDLPDLERGEILYCVFLHAAQSDLSISENIFNACSIQVSYQSTSYNTIAPMVRLRDAIEYTTQSIAGLTIQAPNYEPGKEYYNQFICTTPLLRNLLDKPFNITFKDLVEEFIQPETNGDYELNRDGYVFIGSENDFYSDTLMLDFTTIDTPIKATLQKYSCEINDRYTANKFELKFKNYASQKEAETDNTYDIVHGELQADLRLPSTPNARQIEIGFIRDAAYIEQARRKAFDLSDTSATQDDDKIYILDCIYDSNLKQNTETSLLQHDANGTTLVLRNDSSFSWDLLGIGAGSTFTISSSGNQGSYIVTEVTPQALTLNRTSAGNATDIAEENTRYTYFIRAEVTYVARTNQGFVAVEGVADTRRYVNLNYTAKRIMVNKYGQYLSGYSKLNGNTPIKITKYINNPGAATRLVTEAQPLVEGADFIADLEPVISPLIYEMSVPMNLSDCLNLQNLIQSVRGYIVYEDPSGFKKKGYIKKLEWKANSFGEEDPEGLAEMIVEEKYEKFILTITKIGGVILLNGNENSPLYTINYQINDIGRLSIYDDRGALLIDDVPYDKVQVNNSNNAANPAQLLQWLSLL